MRDAVLGIAFAGVALLGAVDACGPVPAAATSARIEPILLRLDLAVMTATPEAGTVVESQEAQGALYPDSAGSIPASTSSATPYEVFMSALRRSTWAIEDWPTVERRVACENTTYDPSLTKRERNGSVSTGLLMVNSVHEDLARDYDLTDPLQNLNAGKIVAERHADAGLPTPWQWCDGKGR